MATADGPLVENELAGLKVTPVVKSGWPGTKLAMAGLGMFFPRTGLAADGPPTRLYIEFSWSLLTNQSPQGRQGESRAGLDPCTVEAEDCPTVKLSHAIPPALALIAVVLWNLPPWRSMQGLETNTQNLRARIEATRAPAAAGDRETRDSPRAPSLATAREPKAIDWRYLSVQALLAEKRNSGDEVDDEGLETLSERLSEMAREELLTALDEIAALGLDPEARAKLDALFVEHLVEKDPEAALARFAGAIRDDPDGVGSELSPALQAWAKLDLFAATAWFDRAIVSGVFESKTLDGRSDARLEFESALAGVLLATDPAAAGRRIGALPEDQRAETLQQITVADLDSAAQKQFIDLTRSLLPVDERDGPFGSAFCELVPDGDYAKATTFLDGIQATPEERAIAAGFAANNRMDEISQIRDVTRDDVAATREWLSRQAPATADRLMGEALAQAASEGGDKAFAKLSEIVLEVHQSSGNDEMLVAFLDGSGPSAHPEQARLLAQKITDPQRREEILESLK